MRTRSDLTERQRDGHAAIAGQRDKQQGEEIRDAADSFIQHLSRHGKERTLHDIAGIWSDRSDIPDYEAIRAAWDRG